MKTLPDARMRKAGIRLRFAWILRVPADEFDALRADRSYLRNRETDTRQYGAATNPALKGRRFRSRNPRITPKPS